MLAPPKQTPSKQDWSGLLLLWGVLKRIFSIFTMVILGGFSFGTTSYVLTLYCYGIGAWIGLPLGCAVGAVLGLRILARDVCVVFGGTCLSWFVCNGVGMSLGWDSFWSGLLACVVASAVANLSYLFVGRLKADIRYAIGIGVAWSSVAILIWKIVTFMLGDPNG